MGLRGDHPKLPFNGGGIQALVLLLGGDRQPSTPAA